MRRSISALKSRRRQRLSVDVLEDRQLLATITVNTAGDTTAGASLSLRQAIEISDGTLSVSSLSAQEQAQVSGAVGATNTIDFNIPTTDQGYDATTKVWTIAVKSALPAISTNAAIIDGYTQPGASPNTLAQADNAVLKIAINGGGEGTMDGLTIAQEGSRVSGLDIENFLGDFYTNNISDEGYGYGIVVTAAGNVQVAGCFIGTDWTGEIAVPNANGVEIETSSNLIGGPNVGDRNVISGNGPFGYGLYFPSPEQNPLGILPTGNLVENNFIGLDAAGAKALANASVGVEDYGSANTYGGTTAGLGNVISGNGAGGITANGSVTVEGNFIGTNATGTVALGNGSIGIGINDASYPAATVAITTTITDNVVSGNVAGGISLGEGLPSSSVYTISNNRIGTNAAGTAALGNAELGDGWGGLLLDGVENATVLNNLISGNQSPGIVLNELGTDVEHNVFQGNKIGSDITGLVALGNDDTGVVLSGSVGTTFGGTGPGQGNLVAFNNGYGIEQDGGAQTPLIDNSIFGNADAGIVSNQLVAAPVLTFTPGSGNSGTLSGTLIGTPGASYVVEIFSNPTVPTVGKEQGKTFIQDVVVVPTDSGSGAFSLTLPVGIYTATATDAIGNTSAFSNAGGTQSLPASTTAVLSSLNPSTAGQQVTFTAVVTASGFAGTPTGTVTFTIDGQTQTPVPLGVVGGVDQAQFVTSTLAVGQHPVTAAYSGDTNVRPSSGSLPTQTVNSTNLPATTTKITSSLSPSTAGQQVTFTAVVSAGTSTGTPTGTVTFTIDGHVQAPAQLAVVGGVDEAKFVTSTLTTGHHSVAAAYSGDSTFAPSAVASPLLQIVNAVATTITAVAAPSVTLVKRFGVHMHPTVLVLSFDTALDSVSATNLQNYVLVGPEGNHIGFKSVSYDSSAHTVTLRPTVKINVHRTYRLTVIGQDSHGVCGVDHALLDGAGDGQPGTDFVTKVTWKNAVITPKQARVLDQWLDQEFGKRRS
jgi:Bacterial Ig-like domain (group 3)